MHQFFEFVVRKQYKMLQGRIIEPNHIILTFLRIKKLDKIMNYSIF